MKYKKIMFMLVLAVFLLSITCVSASEIDDTLASEDTNTIGLSVDKDIIEDNLQTSEENDELALTDNDETLSAKNDTDVLSDNPGTYSGLSAEIGSGGNIELKHDYYTYDGGNPISISLADSVIDGKGAIINMSGSNIRAFTVSASDVTIKNLTIINANHDGVGGAIYFTSSATSGTVTNCNFVDNTAGYGGAVWIYSGTVSNCNFTGNTAGYGGGAVCFWDQGTVSNCNFTGNTATGDGGAVYFLDQGTVSNCNFTGNTATGDGGAINMDSGTVSNCNFVDNKATGDYSYGGGAVYFAYGSGNVINCNFTGNNATTGSAIYFYSTSTTKTVSNSRFLNNRANAEALEITKNDNNITITFTGRNNLLNAIYSPDEVTFTNVTYWGAKGITTVSATMSGPNKAAGQNITVGVVVNGKVVLNEVNVTDDNGMIVLPIIAGENYYISARHDTDSYYTEAETTISNNTKFNVNVTSKTTNNKTVNITAKSNIPNDVVKGKLLFILPNGTQIEATYGANGTWWAEHTFDTYGGYKVNATYVGLDNVTINNGTITINKVNSTITLDNIVLDYGESTNVTVTTTGATGITAKIDGNDVTVINNYNIQISGLKAGNYTLTVTTIPDDDHNPVTATSKITVNKLPTEIILANETLDLKVGDEVPVLANLTPAGAGNLTFTSSNEDLVFVEDNVTIVANSQGQAIITVSFAGNENYTAAENKTITVNVALNDASVSVENDTLNLKVDETCAINATINPDTIMLHIKYTSSNESVATVDKNGIVTAVGEGRAIITLEVGDDEIYAKNSTTVTVTVSKINTTADVSIPENITVGDNSTVNVILPADATGNVTVKVDGEVVDTVPVANGTASVKLPALDAGNHTVEIDYSGDDKYKPASKTATIAVNKDSTNITASDVTATYKVDKYLVITLKDSDGNPLANATVTVDLNTIKNYTTDENGQIKIKVSNMVPKTYSAKISYAGNDNYIGSNVTAKVVVKKATPKITASAKTFKTATKTKKYTITLKDNTGKAIKNAKVTLKVNGKTYKATTNSKGKATFKITKLTKKGTFKATITYTGNKYYNKVTKKANIKVISSWKTISKGSKDKSTVREIQQALKNHGYYLTAYGHYLMVDGVYADCTVRSVKEFQHDKGLKVTGKVDENTAKKLGLI
ncbi:MAG: Ig-like domain repeat protein [Methanobrevibacter sp.]|nr:Ig-like domain repeat protein [Methanobrevibacter sp.]